MRATRLNSSKVPYDKSVVRTLADPAAGFRGGGNLGRRPNLGYP